jgi:hypothetical protein
MGGSEENERSKKRKKKEGRREERNERLKNGNNTDRPTMSAWDQSQSFVT